MQNASNSKASEVKNATHSNDHCKSIIFPIDEWNIIKSCVMKSYSIHYYFKNNLLFRAIAHISSYFLRSNKRIKVIIYFYESVSFDNLRVKQLPLEYDNKNLMI